MRQQLVSIWSLLIASLLICAAGCDSRSGEKPEPESSDAALQQEPAASTSPPELTWQQAVEAVRRGDSVEIRLQQEPVTDTQLAELSGLVNLRRINLPVAQITDAGLEQIARNLPDLELLRIGSPQITDEGLASIAQLQRLRFLHLIGVPITDAGLAHLQQITWLESFYLDGGQVTDEGLSALIKALPELHFHRDQQHLPGDPRRDGH